MLGACFYLFPNEDSSVDGGVVDDAAGVNIEMMKAFVLFQVVPNIRQRLPDLCALVHVFVSSFLNSTCSIILVQLLYSTVQNRFHIKRKIHTPSA